MKLADIYAGMGPDAPAVHMLVREGIDVDVVAHLVIDGEPQTKGRPRFTRTGRTYTPAETKRAEETVAWTFRTAAPGWKPTKDAAFGVVAVFFCSTRHRRDVDNLLKLVLDGLNGVAWVDDMQVSEVSGRIVRGVDDPRSDIVIYRTPARKKPTRPCEQCGAPFDDFPSQASRRFCSAACGYAWRRAQRTRTCEHCGTDFARSSPTSSTKYCSTTCKTAAGRITLVCDRCGTRYSAQRSIAARSKRQACSPECRAAMASTARGARARGTCTTCGGPTSKKQYIQCAACRALHPSTGDT